MQESNIDKIIHVKIPYAMSGVRLDVALSSIIPDISRNKLANWIKDGYVTLNNKIMHAKEKVVGGEEVIVHTQLSEDALAYTPNNIPINVLYADDDILIIYKPAGMVVHPGNGNWTNTLLNALLFHYPQQYNIPRAGIVHRLDKDTSGLLVVARSIIAQISLIDQLKQHQVLRIYHALVTGHPPLTGSINRNIGRDPRNRIRMITLDIGGKHAITHYKVLEYFDNVSYVECQLETGRTHQIRAHFKFIGHALVGDQTYGASNLNYPLVIANAIDTLKRQALHALQLSLYHPISRQLLDFKCPIPADIQHVIDILRISRLQQ